MISDYCVDELHLLSKAEEGKKIKEWEDLYS